MPRYTFNGKTYNIPDEKVDSFLTKNLSAEPLNINSFSDVETTQEKEQQQEIVKETKPEIKEPNELDDHGVKLDPAEVDLEKVIEKADEKTLNKLKKDIDREINTKKERKSGWLDDLGSGFYKD